MPTLNEPDQDLLGIARALLSEYDGLRGSRSVKAVLRLREKLGKKAYDPLVLNSSFPHNKMWMRLAANENRTNRYFREHLPRWIEELPVSNGTAYYAHARRPRVGIITDSFMYDYYESALDLTYLYPDTYEQTLSENDLDFVLYVTCWHGRHDQEDYYYTNDEAGHARIRPVLERARALGLPVVFQSIEDPPSYHEYLDLARLADWVFTSCVEKVPDYCCDLGHDRAFASRFGVNPLLNNPIGIGRRHAITHGALSTSVLFAGSWYPQYAERRADTRLIFDALLEMGRNLTIIDRRWPLDWGAAFPEDYWHYLVPNMEHRMLQSATKLFDFAVSLNSVKNSETMCAMRTYELQAMGVVGIANDTLALRTQYPDLPRIAAKEDVFRLFEDMDDVRLRAMQREGVRRIMSNDTVFDRLNLMFSQMGMEEPFPAQHVALVADAGNEASVNAARALEDGMPHAHAVLVDDGAVASAVERAAGCRFALRVAGLDGENATFLQDALNAFKYTDVAFVAGCREDSAARYSFTEELAPEGFPVLFDLERCSMEDVLLGRLSNGRATGFLVPLEEG